ncbi:hypothetical protein SDC9_178772 [bioreactor metagenome]|uniref:Uncharacterized protein n=1 Tax=bioreactor metagenome TaxID=1076179 RepID=A0A645GX44_9ZZZZ
MRILAGAHVERAEFSDRVAITDLKPGRLVLILLVLRLGADRAELEDLVVTSNAGMPFDNDMRSDPRAITDLDVSADDGIGADRHIRADLSVRVNDGSGVDHGLVFNAHISSASVAIWSPTRATPLYL